MASITLLERLSINDIFHLYLENAHSELLKSLEIDEFADQAQLIVKFHEMLNILKSSVSRINSCFTSNERTVGALVEYMQVNIELQNNLGNSLSALYSKNTNINLILQFILDSIEHRKPLEYQIKLGPRFDSILELTRGWKESLKLPIQERIRNLLEKFSSIKTLKSVGSELMEEITKTVERFGKDSEISAIFFADSSIIWLSFFHEAFLQRSKFLLEQNFKELLEIPKQIIQDIISKTSIGGILELNRL
jgi:hypothetical protein